MSIGIAKWYEQNLDLIILCCRRTVIEGFVYVSVTLDASLENI